MRLDKFLADANLGTRKHVKTLIRKKHVKVGEKVIIKSDFNFNPESEQVFVDGNLIEYHREIFLLLNKPEGYICSSIDELYPSVLNLIDPKLAKRVKIVGRLDVDTTGVLLLTDQGKINNRLIHPKLKIEKEYHAVLNRNVPIDILPDLNGDIEIGQGEIVTPKKVELINENTCRIIITEGKYHEVKRIFKHFGLEVVKLERKRLGFITASGLEKGNYRFLTFDEVEKIKRITKMI